MTPYQLIQRIKHALDTEENDYNLVKVALDANEAERRMSAIIMYAQGVKEDFPETKIWMDNIIKLAGR